MLTSVFRPVPTRVLGATANDKKWVIARQLALMCCKDLLPFDIVDKPGFVKFLIQNNAVKQEGDLPDATTLSHSALNTVYDEIVTAVKDVINKARKTVAVTTDMWTDNYRRRSFMAVTLHFCLPDFTLQSIVLKTAVFTEAHTGDNIEAELKKTLTFFGLEDKTVVYVTDQGSNIQKACRNMESESGV